MHNLSSLTLNCMLGNENNIWNEYVEKQSEPSWLSYPFVLFGIMASPIQKNLTIQKSTVYSSKENKSNQVINFTFIPDHQSKSKQAVTLSIPEHQLIQALNQPTCLENDRRRVCITIQKLIHPELEKDDVLSIGLKWFCGSGYRLYDIAMFFDKNNRLTDINVIEKYLTSTNEYKGKSVVLFTANNLVSKSDQSERQALGLDDTHIKLLISDQARR